MVGIILNNLPFPESDISEERPNLALGRLMSAWGQIEVVCNFLFRRLTDLHLDAATIVFDTVGNKEQIEILTGLAELLPNAAQRDALSILLSSVKAFSIRRNKIIHANWGTLSGEPARFWSGLTSTHFDEIWSGSQKGDGYLQNLVHTVTRLEGIVSDMVQLRLKLEKALDYEIPDGPSGRHQREMMEKMIKRREEIEASLRHKP
ncbi:hypothetical protein LB561_22035 [Mesorhizobium sp. B292B1B]|uniref:hypothetical protein n=1 Tax=unclassified Mesorhizobium TaxID=325217 RepID=UPI0011279109|nr:MULTISPECIES: hypothetical protein [unclassified Mesorhizobium]MCA0015875.1 hypothetical protein [Mesorhizobium sp. B294B1A1]MCA0039962.1 hypothetical protein [Mesorhizobium sp. B292B1B]TPM43214.1 hypothetical protein FJ964_21055 [Mesorhizobium sp. B2-3-2]